MIFNSQALPVTLRRIRPDDARGIASLAAHPAVYAQVLQMPYPTESGWRERITASDMKADAHDLQLVAEQGGHVVGCAGLHSAGPHVRRRHAVGLGIMVAHEAQGQGVGSALMTGLLDYADRWTDILRIELTVFVDNAQAIALYRRFGFEEEGRLRGFGLRDGRYTDCVSMARWHPAPPAGR